MLQRSVRVLPHADLAPGQTLTSLAPLPAGAGGTDHPLRRPGRVSCCRQVRHPEFAQGCRMGGWQQLTFMWIRAVQRYGRICRGATGGRCGKFACPLCWCTCSDTEADASSRSHPASMRLKPQTWCNRCAQSITLGRSAPSRQRPQPDRPVAAMPLQEGLGSRDDDTGRLARAAPCAMFRAPVPAASTPGSSAVGPG